MFAPTSAVSLGFEVEDTILTPPVRLFSLKPILDLARDPIGSHTARTEEAHAMRKGDF